MVTIVTFRRMRDLRRNGAKLRSVRDPEVIDSELRLLLAIRKMALEAEGRTPNTARIDALLDERSATTFAGAQPENTGALQSLSARRSSAAGRACP